MKTRNSNNTTSNPNDPPYTTPIDDSPEIKELVLEHKRYNPAPQNQDQLESKTDDNKDEDERSWLQRTLDASLAQAAQSLKEEKDARTMNNKNRDMDFER